MDRSISKQIYYWFAKFVRQIEKQYFPSGCIGEQGGIDGEMSSSAMWQVCEIIREETHFDHPDRYGVDLGHGTGAAIFISFNFELDLCMVGVELNEYRCNYSWGLHRILSALNDNEYKKLLNISPLFQGDVFKECNRISKMTLLFQGDANKVLRDNLGENPALAFLVYWFSNGWSEEDIKLQIEYLNSFLNLEWLITNMSEETLKQLGFQGFFLLPSRFVRGKLVKSTSHRTLFIHHLERRSGLQPHKVICSKRESLIVGSFRSSARPVQFSNLQTLQMEKAQSTSLRTRHLRHGNVAKGSKSCCPKFEMKSLRRYLSTTQMQRMYRRRFTFRHAETKQQLLKQKTSLDEKSSSKPQISIWGKCLNWLFGSN